MSSIPGRQGSPLTSQNYPMPKSTFPIPDLNTEWEKEATREGSRHWWRRTREMSGRQLEKAEGALSSRLEQLTPLPSEKLRGRFLLQKESQRRCTRRHAPRGSLGLQLVTFQTWAHPPKGGGEESSLKSVHTELGKGFEKEAASERKHPSLSPKDRTRTTEIPKYLGNETQLKCGPLSGQMGGTGPEVRLPGGRRLWSKTLWV